MERWTLLAFATRGWFSWDWPRWARLRCYGYRAEQATTYTLSISRDSKVPSYVPYALGNLGLVQTVRHCFLLTSRMMQNVLLPWKVCLTIGEVTRWTNRSIEVKLAHCNSKLSLQARERESLNQRRAPLYLYTWCGSRSMLGITDMGCFRSINTVKITHNSLILIR